MKERRRRAVVVLLLVIAISISSAVAQHNKKPVADNAATLQQSQIVPSTNANIPATEALGKLAVKGRAPKTGYSRTQYGGEWNMVGTCNMRDKILARDMTDVRFKSAADCDVVSGTLNDPYTGQTMQFIRGPSTSSAIQIDHVVAISNTWQTGAQQLSPEARAQLYNDPLELLAVDGKANNDKSDGDAATWLPPNKDYRCRYVARQIAVKTKYSLWLTPAEHDAMATILDTCPTQLLPVAN